MAIGAGGVDLGTLQNAGAAPKLIRASKTFTGAANLGAVGVNELFTVTGTVLLDGFWVRCTSDMVDAVDGAVFTIGVTGAALRLSDWSAIDLDTLDAGDFVDTDAAATDGYGIDLVAPVTAGGMAVVDNLIMTISTQAITGGVLAFYVLYRGLSADGALSLGAGMVAI